MTVKQPNASPCVLVAEGARCLLVVRAPVNRRHHDRGGEEVGGEGNEELLTVYPLCHNLSTLVCNSDIIGYNVVKDGNGVDFASAQTPVRGPFCRKRQYVVYYCDSV